VIEEILEDRENDYGTFALLALLSQSLKKRVSSHDDWALLAPDKRESIEMILHKIARIVTGNSNKKDSWDDIAGYAILISKTLEEKQ
jgi:hypothetical protein